MSHHKDVRQVACAACKATGLYVGMAERDGSAVVCYKCHGTGAASLVVEWDDFEGRQECKGVSHVYGANPGIAAAPSVVPGGVPYAAWKADINAPHRRGTEMREHTCPAWWYQTTDYSKKPHWNECEWGRFSNCKHFPDKAACWRRFDKESTP